MISSESIPSGNKIPRFTEPKSAEQRNTNYSPSGSDGKQVHTYFHPLVPRLVFPSTILGTQYHKMIMHPRRWYLSLQSMFPS